MAKPPKRTYRQRSEEYAKQVSSEIIEQIKKAPRPGKNLGSRGNNTPRRI